MMLQTIWLVCLELGIEATLQEDHPESFYSDPQDQVDLHKPKLFPKDTALFTFVLELYWNKKFQETQKLESKFQLLSIVVNLFQTKLFFLLLNNVWSNQIAE